MTTQTRKTNGSHTARSFASPKQERIALDFPYPFCMCCSGPSSVAAFLRSTTVSGCQDFVFPRICRLLYVRLAGLLYKIRIRVGPNHVHSTCVRRCSGLHCACCSCMERYTLIIDRLDRFVSLVVRSEASQALRGFLWACVITSRTPSLWFLLGIGRGYGKHSV